jgi:hypothetical protein
MDIFLSFSCQRGGEEKVGIFQYVIEFVVKNTFELFFNSNFFWVFFYGK